MRAAGPAVVVYDGACRLCTAAARVGAALDRRRRLRWVPAGDERALRACGLGPLPVHDASVTVHRPAGPPLTEVDAVAAIAEAWPLAGPPLARALRAGRPALAPGYRWVSRNRGRLSRGLPRVAPPPPPG